MNDCPNGDVRDLLPDLMHDRLDATTRRTVEAHLESCADCRAELALLRDLRASMSATPAIDVGAIAAAIPARRARTKPVWRDWRIAASIAVLAVGGTSVALVNRAPEPVISSLVGGSDPAPDAPSTPRVVPVDSPAKTAQVAAAMPRQQVKPVVPAPTRVVASSHELHVAEGSLGELSEDELTSLLKEIEALDALPSTDVESPAISPIAPRRGGA